MLGLAFAILNVCRPTSNILQAPEEISIAGVSIIELDGIVANWMVIQYSHGLRFQRVCRSVLPRVEAPVSCGVRKREMIWSFFLVVIE